MITGQISDTGGGGGAGWQQFLQPLRLIKIRICIFLLAYPPARDALGGRLEEKEGGGDVLNHCLETSGRCFQALAALQTSARVQGMWGG